MQMYHIIGGVQETSFCDYDDHVSVVFFFKGCNWRCPTCHNHALAYTDVESFKGYSRQQILDYCLKRKPFINGITLTGGEPTLCTNLTSIACDLKKSTGMDIKLDTNGTNLPLVRKLFGEGYIDEAHIDVKGPAHLYPELTGRPDIDGKKLYGDIISFALEFHDKVKLRTTCVPLLTKKDLLSVEQSIPKCVSWTKQKFVDPQIKH